ncbi:glycerate kinase [Microcella sp.]|uniref:glycerate kinase n=1 Tax=Microcella sp. TaxID=1913979 RepID=UPI00391C7A1C
MTQSPRPARIVIAPDSFTGTIDAAAAAEALAAGWAGVRPGDAIVTRPMADGGVGTLDVLAAATPGCERVPITVTGPDDRPVDTHWLLLPDGTGVIELARTSGLTLLDEPRPWTAHTIGVGEAIVAAVAHGVERLVVALGGSGSSDGGAGMLGALGSVFTGVPGRPPRGPAELEVVTAVAAPRRRLRPVGGIIAWVDVTSPLTGEAGAAAVFGPQKGLTDPADIARVDEILTRYALMVSEAFRPANGGAAVDPATPGAGAAGGTGFALLAWGASLRSGAVAVADAIGLDAALAGADLVITGEGRFDGQTAAGKVAHEVARRADAAGTARALVAGAISAEPRGFAEAVSLSELAGSSGAAMSDPARWLRAAGAQLAQRF